MYFHILHLAACTVYTAKCRLLNFIKLPPLRSTKLLHVRRANKMLKVNFAVWNVILSSTVKNSANNWGGGWGGGGGQEHKTENTKRIVTNVLLKTVISKYLSLATRKVGLQIGHPDARFTNCPQSLQNATVPSIIRTKHLQDIVGFMLINTSFGDSQHT